MNTINIPGGITVHNGSALDVLRTLPDASVNCCVTSPPYYALRNYGHDDQIGLEKTPEEFIQKLVTVFREVRRVLRDDGTLWVNIGDSYSGSGARSSNPGGLTEKQLTNVGSYVGSVAAPVNVSGCKPKDLIGIPWMLAFALRADGWYLRQDIIWSKPNPMPESVTDRCTKAHEYVFLLSKSARYFYDAESVAEPAQIWAGPAGTFKRENSQRGVALVPGNHATHRPNRADTQQNGTRNRRSVWNVATEPYSGAHFATFPPKLIEPCILAGCPADGVVLDCFGGSGTTGEVARLLGRKAVLIELNPAYVELMRQRLNAQQMTIMEAA